MSVNLTLIVIAGFATAVVAGLLLVGPAVMQIAFGENFSYDRVGLCIVGAGMGLYLAAATLNQATLAQGQVRRAAACWVGCALVFASINLLPVLDAFRRVEVGFALSAALLCWALLAVYRHPSGFPGDEVLPDSSREVEARLAIADDVV
jgi:O-antigen/teichoic acid export membrane protein